MTQEKAIQEAKLVSKEDIAKKHLARYYQHKGKGSSINLDDIMPMSRILPMMDEYAKEYHRFHLTPASSSSEKGDGPTPEERLMGWLDAQIMGVQALPFFTESQKQESEMLVSRYKKVKEKVLEYLKPVTHQSSKQFSREQVQEAIEETIDLMNASKSFSVDSIIASLTPKEHSEGEIQARDLLDECRLQLEYLNDKFKETGTTNSVLAKVKAFLGQPPKK